LLSSWNCHLRLKDPWWRAGRAGRQHSEGACRPGFYQVRLVLVSSRGCGPVDGSVSGQPFSTSVFPRVRPNHNHRSFSLCFRRLRDRPSALVRPPAPGNQWSPAAAAADCVDRTVLLFSNGDDGAERSTGMIEDRLLDDHGALLTRPFHGPLGVPPRPQEDALDTLPPWCLDGFSVRCPASPSVERRSAHRQPQIWERPARCRPDRSR